MQWSHSLGVMKYGMAVFGGAFLLGICNRAAGEKSERRCQQDTKGA